MAAEQRPVVDDLGNIAVHGRSGLVLVVKIETATAGVYENISASDLFFEIGGKLRLALSAGADIYSRQVILTRAQVATLSINQPYAFAIHDETTSTPSTPWAGTITTFGFKTAPTGVPDVDGEATNWTGATVVIQPGGGSPVVVVNYMGQPGAGVPIGGTAGQYLRKSSSTDYAVGWDTITADDVSGLSSTLSTLTSADTSLTSRIGAEETARAAADTSLTSRLSTEEGARATADTSLAAVDALKAPLASPALSGNVGIGLGVASPNSVYNLHIRSPHGDVNGGAILIDNEVDEDLRYSITIKAGSTTQGRRYIYFREYNQDAGWLMGSNQDNDFILYNGNGHKLVGDGGVNGDTSVNASGTGAVKINVGGSVGGGTGGLILYSGDVNQTRWFSSESAGTFAWVGLPFQAKSPNGSDYIEMKCENGLARITSDTKLTMRGDNTDTLTLSGGFVGIGTTSPAVRLDVVGQVGIGVAGAHSTDYGLTIRNGTFTGSDGYISFVNGPGATEFARLNVNQDGTLRINGVLLELATGGTVRRSINASGHTLATVDNTYDEGALGATRIRSYYAGTSFIAPLGAVGTPGFTFSGDADTGLWSPAADTWALSAGGVETIRGVSALVSVTGALATTTTLTAGTSITAGTSVTATTTFIAPLGAVAAPTYSFTGDSNTGFWSPAADTWALSAGGVETIRGVSGTTTVTGALGITGQATIGVAGAHSTDYGLTINNGSFSGSDGYISFKTGAGATEYARINVNQDGLLKITGTAGIVFRPNASVTPPSNGDVSIELTNNTTLTFKARGSDGTVRSATLTLS